MLRKVVLDELLSLDRVAEAPDTFFADWDEAMDPNLAAVIATQDAVILGRAVVSRTLRRRDRPGRQQGNAPRPDSCRCYETERGRTPILRPK
jgi:hypothetical protein